MSLVHAPPHPLVRLRSLLRTGPVPLALRLLDQLARRTTGVPIWRLCAVTPQLYVGGQHYRRGYAKMRDYGITAILNMRGERCDLARGIGGERHLQLATIDNTPPSLDDLRRGSDFIRAEIEGGGKVYVHCAVGCGRAPIMTAAYLVSTGMSADEALRRVKDARPFVHPTPEQREALNAFATRCQGAAACQS
ncbi:MAG: dual specificity protein phosphatase [Chloroflexi bacterium]|nr:dual specificity protein phosphatase [Chloroflexota bacterium]MCY4247288.1 dual specificity protein phosphatase [Chloroflexota bacterium]